MDRYLRIYLEVEELTDDPFFSTRKSRFGKMMRFDSLTDEYIQEKHIHILGAQIADTIKKWWFTQDQGASSRVPDWEI